jgi:hypothetical protein
VREVRVASMHEMSCFLTAEGMTCVQLHLQEFLVDISDRFSPQNYNLFHHNVCPWRMLLVCLLRMVTLSCRAHHGPVRSDPSWSLFSQCNNFSDEFATFLTGSSIPPHITNLPSEVPRQCQHHI